MKIETKYLPELCKSDGGIFNVNSPEEAYEFCKKITAGHYENFPVGSILLPPSKREHFYPIYSFARIADDISDEIAYDLKIKKIELLEKFDSQLEDKSFLEKKSGNPVFLALSRTLQSTGIPAEPFHKLIKAFKMDADFEHAETFSDLEHYCTFSANPVGEIVLRLFDNYNEKTKVHSDQICTGLQFANFWQDISVDTKKKRVYIPSNVLNKNDLTYQDIIEGNVNDNFSYCLKEIYDYTDKFFNLGTYLIYYVRDFRLKTEIALTIEGGRRIMSKSKALGTDIVRDRPKLGKIDFLFALVKSLRLIF